MTSNNVLYIITIPPCQALRFRCKEDPKRAPRGRSVDLLYKLKVQLVTTNGQERVAFVVKGSHHVTYNKCHATSNKCHASSNRCLTSSNKKLLEAS